MPRATLTVKLPEGLWVRQLSTAYPDATLRVLSVMPDGGHDSGVVLLAAETPELDSFVGDLAAADAVTNVHPLQAVDDRAVLQFETDQALVLSSALSAGVAVEPPVTLEGPRATLRVAGTRERLSELVDRLETLGLAASMEYLYPGAGRAAMLTATQRDLVEAAFEAGYYETPRSCSLTELADRVDAAKSTVSETLRRAESRIVGSFLDGDVGGDTAVRP
jgi:predicted DNA binding protein